MSIALWKTYNEQEIQNFYNQATSIKDFFIRMGYKNAPNLTMKSDFQQKYPQFPLQKIARQQGIENLIGQQFGSLKVLELDSEKTKKKKTTYWICECNHCGNKVIVAARNLKSGNSQSCGCNRARNQRIDLTGKTFGLLTVIEQDIETSLARKDTYWKCKCACGSIKSYCGRNLKTGNTQSCGCKQLSHGELKIIKIFKQLNVFFIQQKTFEELKGNVNNLKFDFFLPNEKICIEYQGEQHYKAIDCFGGEEEYLKRQEYDQKKRDYCQLHNIRLIEIPYWDYNKIDEEYILNIIQ